jgi:hypothetical protein
MIEQILIVLYLCLLPFVLILNIAGIIWVKYGMQPTEKQNAKIKKTIDWVEGNA